MEKISIIFREFGIFILVGIVGSGILIYGLWGELVPERASVEIIKTGEQTNKPMDQQTNVTTNLQGKVNINTGSLSELDSLEGIGEVRARLILDNRPYSKIDDLVVKAKIPESVYEKIKDKISVY